MTWSGLRALAAPPPKKPAARDLTPQYNAYLNRLRNKVLNAWNYPDGKNHVVLEATVGSDGSVAGTVLKSTPQNAAAEQAANAAFAQAQPLEALPQGSAPNAKITFTFDSTSDPHGDSSANLSGRLDPIQLPKSPPPTPGTQ
jgi:outer membrane biosynthesis protein TonB